MNKLFVYFIITVIVLFILYFLLKRVGIIQAPESKEVREARADQIKTITDLNQQVIDFKKSPLFNPSYMNSIPFSNRMDYDTATRLAKEIEKAWGWLNDNEKRVYNAFSQINKQSDVSSIAYYYRQLFDEDLRSKIIDKFTKSEIRNVWNIIQSKPRV